MLLTLHLHELSHDTVTQTYQTAAGKHDTFMIQSWNIKKNKTRSLTYTARPKMGVPQIIQVIRPWLSKGM
jgi:hypothetical protein